MNRWMGTIGTGALILVAAAATGQAQQRGMTGGQMHADTTPAASPCPRGMGGIGMMGMMHGPGMMRGPAGEGAGMMKMRRGTGHGMMGHGMMGPRMGMMGASPSMLLAHRDVLELTGEQVTRLEELREKHQGMMKGMHKGMMAVRSQMHGAMSADSLDMEDYRSAAEAMADQMVGHHVQMARFRKQVLDVLTSEQREKLRTGMQMMRHMIGGRGTGGSMH